MKQTDQFDRKASVLASTPSAPPSTQILGIKERAVAASEFSHTLDAAAVAGQLDGGLGLQVYLPFCTTRCVSCDRVAEVAADSTVIDRYLDGLARELQCLSDRVGRGRPLTQLHIGGGTPSLLSSTQLARVAELIDRHFLVPDDCETVFEINPDRTSLTQMELIRGLGFKNIRIELRELDPQSQQGLGRSYSPELLADVMGNAKLVGFDTTTLELLYGLPGQSVKAVRESLQLITELDPSRILLGSFTRNEKRFEHQRVIESDSMPSVAEKMAMFITAVDQLESSGYQWVGINSFVKPGDVLGTAQAEGRLFRNRLGYSDQPTRVLLGVGLGAVSELPNLLSRNHASLDQWHAALRSDQHPVCAGVPFTATEAKQRRLLQKLSESLRAPVSAFEGEEQRELLSKLQSAGLVTAESAWVRVTPSGRVKLMQLWDANTGDIRLASGE